MTFLNRDHCDIATVPHVLVEHYAAGLDRRWLEFWAQDVHYWVPDNIVSVDSKTPGFLVRLNEVPCLNFGAELQLIQDFTAKSPTRQTRDVQAAQATLKTALGRKPRENHVFVVLYHEVRVVSAQYSDIGLTFTTGPRTGVGV